MSGRQFSSEVKKNSFDPEEESIKWMHLIYNKQEGTILGRNTESWGKIFKI